MCLFRKKRTATPEVVAKVSSAGLKDVKDATVYFVKNFWNCIEKESKKGKKVKIIFSEEKSFESPEKSNGYYALISE